MDGLAQRLRRLRRQHGHALKTVSASTGISLSYLSEIERGLAVPALAIVQRLAQYYGVEPGNLLTEAPQAEEHPSPPGFEEFLREIEAKPEIVQLLLTVERHAEQPARTVEDWRELYYALKRLLGR